MSLNIRSSRQPATIINIHSPTNTSGSDSEYIQSNSSRQPPSTSVKVSPKVEECRKVIQLITGKLLKRKTPPTCLFYLPDLSLHTQSVDQFDNEDTVELLMQLRTALIMCITIGLSEEVLLQKERSPTPSPVSSPHMKNSKSAEMLSPSVQYTGPKTDKQPDLIKILQILSDLIMNDSRYKSANPKPTRPPYIMQTTLIDIAYILVQIAKDPADLYQVGTVYLPGFEAFPKEALVGKLMSFYVDALLPKLMKCKEESKPKIPEMKAAQPSVSTRASKKNPNTPTINIHSPEPEETNNPAKVSNLTIDTSYFPADVNSQYLAYSPTSPNVNTTTNTKSNDTFAYALFTPLLYFMIQYLDPYLTSAPKASGTDTLSHTLTQQASSIHNFHRGLSYMMTCKPDLYLDILDVISNSTSDVKLRACQILFHYYFMSVGHVIVTRPLPKLGVKEELVALEDYRYQEEREERKQYGRFGSNDTSGSGKFPKIDILDNDPIDNHHIWYPHMFPNSQKKQSDTTEYHLNTTNARPIIVQSGINDADCIKCHTSIKGYGLRCYQCKGNSHYNCSNSSGLSEDRVMIYHKPGGIQRMVLPHFCVISPQPRFVDVVEKGIAGWTMKSNAAKVGLLGHSFQLVNSFTLMICMCCGLPLWGPFHQGYCCSSCNQFIHPQCLLRAEENSFTSKEQFSSLEKCKSQKPLQAKDIQISYTKLYASFYEYYGDFLPRELEDLEGKGFEETSEILNVLLIQENIIRYGIAAGTITILQYNPLSPSSIAQDLPFPMTGSSNETNGISSILGTAIELCSEYLRSGKCRASTYLSEFFSNKHSNIDDCLLSKESYLSHLSAMMKSLTVSSSTFGSLVQSFVTTPGSAASPIAHPFDKRKSAGDSRGFLQVLPNSLRSPKYEWNSFENHFADEQTPHDTLNRSALLSWIMANLNFKNRKLGEILLQHMQNMGLFERFDASPILFHMDSSDNHYPESKLIQCIFPVPYAIDNSFNVEALIGAIDSCLTDVNISVNECGFLLLIHRCWPDPFLSSYTSERLIYIILKWILDEDERLLLLHSELIANKNTELGGNRLQTKWAQPAFISKMMGAGGDRSRQSAMFYNVGTGISEGGSGDYVLVRSMLKERYLMNWLATIQEIDKEAYGNMLFKAIEDIIDDKREECVVPDWSETSNDKRYITQKYEQFISNIYKLRKYGVTLSSLEIIMQKWFDQAYYEFEALGILDEDQPMELRHLAKLCASKSPQSKAVNLTHSELAQPMDIITSQFSTGEKASLDRGFRWLTLVTHAGTALPLNSLEQISQMLINNQSSLGILAQFLKIVWFQTVNIVSQQTSGLNVLNILEKLNKYAQVKLKDLNESEKISNESMINTQMFVKYCIALSCYYYCCPLKKIISLGIVPYPGEHALNISSAKRGHVNESLILNEVSPLIESMIEYLHYSQLEICEDVIKFFYAISCWGKSIQNRNQFIQKCMPSLMPSLWRLLVPAYDHMSHFNIGLLMKLVVVDPLYFRKYVSRIFEGDDWEAKYQSLDNIFGLFSKMDDPFLSKWMSNLSELGFLFSYFAGCLWDKEGYVRSKAITLIRTFNLLHLRSAFRCWEAHFMTATIGKRIALLHLMIQLNALFPTWQVIEWDSLLEALEDKLPSNKDNAAVDYLEDYMRSSVDSTTNNLSDQANAQESFDYDNSKLLMLTLALQMVGNRLEILPIQINRLKYIIVQNMGFKNCHFFNTSEQGAVTFGTLVFNPENTMQISLLFACIRGLKGVIDSFAPLNPKSVAQAIDSTEHIKNNFSEISSPGVYFLDIIFKMMNSGVSLTSLGHMMLKCWLEIILVVIYKHSILEQEYEQDIVSCMKQIIELLIEDISEENKLIILEILKCLLRRSDHLTAMVLSKQIFALGKLMTRTGARHSEPIFLKAKQFLKNAFLRFAVAGLFVLMFKNQTITQSDDKELDLFFILRTVIDPDDVVPDEEVHGEIIYLRDQPLRDVLDKLMKQQIERKSFSTVLYNTNKYVESVHRYPYSENILRDYSSFLNALIRHTTDWRRSDWDINPVLTMSATLLKEHRYYHATLLLSIQALLKHGLQNCFIQPESVIKLLAAYSFVSAIPGMQKQNVFVDIILDDVKNSLLSTKANKDTLLTLLQVMLWDIKPSSQAWFGEIENRFTDSKMVRERIYYFDKRMTGLTAHFVDFLQTARSKQFTKKDLKLFCVVAQLLVSICKRNNQIVDVLSLLKLDETLHCLRCLNWFILTLIMEKEDLLLQILNQYESVITDILVQTFNSVHIDFNTPDLGFSYSTYYEALSLSFLLLKAWVILKLRNTSRMGDRVPISSYQNPISFWMSVWPALNRILNMVEPSTLRMSGNAGVSVWNMFLSLLQFLFSIRSESIMINAYEWSMLLDDLMFSLDNKENTPLERNMDQSMSLDDFKNDIRKLRNMFDIPPVEVPAPVMINQMFIDLKEIMRLQAENMVIMDTRQVQEQA